MKQVEHIQNEVSLLSSIEHPGIVNMYGHFMDATKLYLVMEYVEGGELFSHLRSAVRFPDHQAKLYTAEIVLAFSYLHDLNIVYRDLKPENLLITRHGRIKITDFGSKDLYKSSTLTHTKKVLHQKYREGIVNYNSNTIGIETDNGNEFPENKQLKFDIEHM